jgi:hypothetical protein
MNKPSPSLNQDHNLLPVLVPPVSYDRQNVVSCYCTTGLAITKPTTVLSARSRFEISALHSCHWLIGADINHVCVLVEIPYVLVSPKPERQRHRDRRTARA